LRPARLTMSGTTFEWIRFRHRASYIFAKSRHSSIGPARCRAVECRTSGARRLQQDPNRVGSTGSKSTHCGRWTAQSGPSA
jgi:hypothetical protein